MAVTVGKYGLFSFFSCGSNGGWALSEEGLIGVLSRA